MTKQTPIHLSREHPTIQLQPLDLIPDSIANSAETTKAEKARQRTFLMNFCPNCQAVLELVHGKSVETHCRKCHYKAKFVNNRILERKIDPSAAYRSEIAVVDRQESRLRTYPVIRSICSECNNDTSETWTMAIGSDGTTGITFLRCTACGYTRREAE